MSNAKSTEKFSGWIVFIFATIIYFFLMGFYNTTSSYTAYICDAHGFARADYQLTWTIASLITAVFLLFFMGPAYKKLGGRMMLVIGSIAMAAGFTVLTYATTLPMFYLGGALLGLTTAFAGASAIISLVSAWFVKGRGTIVGITSAASGLGGTAMNTIVVPLIATDGQGVFLYCGIAALATAVLALIFIKDTPEKYGQKPLGAGEVIVPKEGKKPKRVDEAALVTYDITVKEFIPKPFFWITAVGVFILSIVAHPVVTAMGALLADVGFDPGSVGSMMASFYFVLAVYKVIFGVIYDFAGPKIMLILTGVFGAIGCICIANVSVEASGLFIAFLFFYCAFNTGQTAQMPLLISQIAGSRNLFRFLGIFSAILSVGGIIGSQALASLYDATGSYQTLLMYVYPVLCIIAAALLLIGSNMARKYHTQRRAASGNAEVQSA